VIAEVAACTARQWFRYAFGRSEETPGDECTIQGLGATLTRPGGDFRAMVRATVRMPAFRAMETQP
jgi:hypothetical protein